MVLHLVLGVRTYAVTGVTDGATLAGCLTGRKPADKGLVPDRVLATTVDAQKIDRT